MSPGPEGSYTGLRLVCRLRHLLHHRSYQCLKIAHCWVSKMRYLHKGVLKPLPVGFLPAVKPSWGARASICAGVTEEDDGVADGAVGVLLLLIVGVRDDDCADGLADEAGGVALLIVGV